MFVSIFTATLAIMAAMLVFRLSVALVLLPFSS